MQVERQKLLMRKRSLFFFSSSSQLYRAATSVQSILAENLTDNTTRRSPDDRHWCKLFPQHKVRHIPSPSTPVNQSKRCAAYLATKHQRQSVVGAGNFAVAQQRGAIRAFDYGRHSRDQKEWGKKNGKIDFAVVQILWRKTSSWSRTRRARASKRIHASREKGIA